MNDSGEWILDDLPVGVWVGRAPDGQVVYVNRAFREFMGKDAVVASRIGDVPDTYNVRNRAGHAYPVEQLPFSRVLATDQAVVDDDLVIHRPDGRHVNLRALGRPVRDSQGRIDHVILAFIDITREVHAETGRATNEARLKVAVDHAPIVVWEIDRAGLITLSEGAGLQGLGVQSGELVGKTVFDLYRDHPDILANVRRGLAGESFWYASAVGEVQFDTWLTPIRNQEGQPVGARAVSHNTSELRHLQAATIQSDRGRALGALAASVAHEINNPLTYVLTYLATAEQEVGKLDRTLAALPQGETRQTLATATRRLQDLLAPVRNGVARIATVTRDLKSFSRPDDARLEAVDVRKVVQVVLQLLRKDIEARAKLVLALDATAPILGNEARLVQVVMNLLMNALQSLPDTGPDHNQIVLSVRRLDDTVAIEVGDTGPGVLPGDRERIFEPFFTTKQPGQGTGLGLFVCRNIVRDLGGDISVQERPGGGALFRVRLPAAVPAGRTSDTDDLSLSEELLSPPPAAVAVSPARVLVVDDDELVAESIARQIRADGHRVEVQTSGTTALEAILAEPQYDLIYCDLMMPVMTGMDLAAALQERAPARLTRVVFMTGAAFTPRAADFVAANPETSVQKPFNVIAETRRRLADLNRNG